MTSTTLNLQERLHTSVGQNRNEGLDARRSFKFVAFDPVDFPNGLNRHIGFTRKQLHFRFSFNLSPRIYSMLVHISKALRKYLRPLILSNIAISATLNCQFCLPEPRYSTFLLTYSCIFSSLASGAHLLLRATASYDRRNESRRHIQV
jgi:hypothetical protein